MTTGSLTVLFEDPFWIGLFEMIDQQGLRACKVTFGAEPTDKEVIEFVDKNWHRLQFSQAIEVSAESERAKVNHKRQLREARKQMQSQGIGKQLFREIQSRLPHRHAWLCTCQQVRPPYEFYLREGFKLYRSEEVGPGLTWAYLEKSIQAPRFTFNTVGLFTNNNKATVEFYTKTFGFTTSWDGVQPNVEMFLGNNRIILFPRSAFEQMVSKRFQYPEGFNGTMELSFDVPTFADVDKEYQNTLNCGAKSVLPPTTEPWGQRTCYVADPDGNLIEIGSFVKQ